MSINGLKLFPTVFTGKFIGNQHWKDVTFSAKGKLGSRTVHVDSSDMIKIQVDNKDYYVAPGYNQKTCGNSFFISATCLLMPLIITFFVFSEVPYLSTLPQEYQITILVTGCTGYLALSLAYNAARIGGIALFLLFHMLYEMGKKGKVVEVFKSHCKEFVKQTALSVINIVRAPFYALLYQIGHIYTLISPLNGRKFTTKIEQAWNHGIPLMHGCSAAFCFHPRFGLEGCRTLTNLELKAMNSDTDKVTVSQENNGHLTLMCLQDPLFQKTICMTIKGVQTTPDQETTTFTTNFHAGLDKLGWTAATPTACYYPCVYVIYDEKQENVVGVVEGFTNDRNYTECNKPSATTTSWLPAGC